MSQCLDDHYASWSVHLSCFLVFHIFPPVLVFGVAFWNGLFSPGRTRIDGSLS